MKEVFIRGFKVRYEEGDQSGINYLFYDLDAEESRVFFDQAKQKKYAAFEDDKEGQFSLSYTKDGSFTLMRR